MNIPRCSPSVWKNLYDAAVAFREIACWEWMSDADLVGVQNANGGEVGYCCVLGEFGEVFGLVVYLGRAGLEQHRKIQSGKIRARSSDAVYSQNCLTVWFGSHSELDKNDLKVVKELGLKFRGNDAWPQFRSMQPGYIPWYLTQEEAIFLTFCLAQARQVALRFDKDPNYLTAPAKNLYLVQVPKPKADFRSAQPSGSSVAPGQQTLFPEALEVPEFEWDSKWLPPAPLAKATIRPVPLDELRLQRIKKASQRHRGPWEIDAFFTPSPVDNGDRPFLPFTLLWAEPDSGTILGTTLAEVKNWEAEFSKTLIESIEQQKILPQKLSLRKEELRELFTPLATQLGIQIEKTNKLPAVDRAKRGLLKFMKERL